jgi:hypothetical protein
MAGEFMFKHLLSSGSVHTVAIPIALSVAICLAIKVIGIHGTSASEYLDICLTIIGFGAMIGVILIVLNVDDRLQRTARDVELISQYLKESQRRENIRDTISKIGSISREISKDVRKLEEWEDGLRTPEPVEFGATAGDFLDYSGLEIGGDVTRTRKAAESGLDRYGHDN